MVAQQEANTSPQVSTAFRSELFAYKRLHDAVKDAVLRRLSCCGGGGRFGW